MITVKFVTTQKGNSYADLIQSIAGVKMFKREVVDLAELESIHGIKDKESFKNQAELDKAHPTASLVFSGDWLKFDFTANATTIDATQLAALQALVK